MKRGGEGVKHLRSPSRTAGWAGQTSVKGAGKARARGRSKEWRRGEPWTVRTGRTVISTLSLHFLKPDQGPRAWGPKGKHQIHAVTEDITSSWSIHAGRN